MNNITTPLNITDFRRSSYLEILMFVPIFAAILLIILCNIRKDIFINKKKKNKITPYKNTN